MVFEAGDGVGKSTQVDLLNDYYINERGITPFVCRQPGNTELGNIIRSIVLSNKHKDNLCKEAERLLFAADQAQFIEDIIIPKLSNTEDVILQDRYTTYSNFAYGVHGSGVDPKFMELLEVVTRGYYPDIVFVLDLDPVVARQRIQQRIGEATRIDQLSLEFHKRVREGYLELAKADTLKFRIIDASKNPELIHQEVVKNLLEMEEI